MLDSLFYDIFKLFLIIYSIGVILFINVFDDAFHDLGVALSIYHTDIQELDVVKVPIIINNLFLVFIQGRTNPIEHKQYCFLQLCPHFHPVVEGVLLFLV